MLFSVLVFLIILLVLVLAHEWGHYITARLFGVRVNEFGFGFPPRILKLWHRHGTDFTLNLVPLGGFVRLKGEDGSEAADADSFAHKTAWRRLIILFAGVAMNFVLGYFILVFIYGHGAEMAVPKNDPQAIVANQRLMIDGVLAGSPAAVAGVLAGDVIVGVDDAAGKKVGAIEAEAVRDFIVSHRGQPLTLNLRRGNDNLQKIVTPTELKPGVIGLGVQLFEVGTVRYRGAAIFGRAGKDTAEITTLIFKTLGTVIKKLVRHGELEQGVTGPVGIAVVTGSVARLGLIPLLQLVAMLSINLGLLNALPFPALDGGRALFVLLEKVMRKKVRMEIERAAHLIGLALLLALIVAVTYRDIVGLWH